MHSRILSVLIVVLAFAAAAGSQIPADPTASTEESVAREALRNAEALYWIGIEEGGLLEALECALDELDRAETALSAAPAASHGASERRNLELQIRTLRAEVQGQHEQIKGSFFGVFPLARLIVPTLFKDARVVGTVELVDPPGRVATAIASKKIVLEIIGIRHPHVVVNSRPPNREFEGQAIAVLATSAKPSLHTRSEVVALLSEEQLESYDRGEITPRIQERLLEGLGAELLLVIDIVRRAVVAKDHLYVLEGRFYQEGSEGPMNSFARRAIARDRRDQLVPLVATNLVLFLLSLVLYPVFARMHGRYTRSLGALAASGGAAFALGRLLAWVAIPLLNRIEPVPETPAILAWWWPALIGLVLIALPGFVCVLLSMRLRRLFGMKGDRAVGAIYGVSMLGMCAYLAGPLLLLEGSSGLWLLIPLCLAASGLSNILGGALRTGPPIAEFWGFFPALLSPLLGVFLLRARPGPLWLLVVVTFALSVAVAVHHFSTRKHHPREPDEEAAYSEDEEKLRAVEEALGKKLSI